MRLSDKELKFCFIFEEPSTPAAVESVRQELILARKVIEAARYAEEPTGKIFFGDVNNEVQNRRNNFRKALKAYDAGAKE